MDLKQIKTVIHEARVTILNKKKGINNIYFASLYALLIVAI